MKLSINKNYTKQKLHKTEFIQNRKYFLINNYINLKLPFFMNYLIKIDNLKNNRINKKYMFH